MSELAHKCVYTGACINTCDAYVCVHTLNKYGCICNFMCDFGRQCLVEVVCYTCDYAGSWFCVHGLPACILVLAHLWTGLFHHRECCFIFYRPVAK